MGDLGTQPLSVVNLPKTKESAIGATRYPLNFHICAFCGHVWNSDFDDTRVPYTEDSCYMYNQGQGWQVHIANVVEMMDQYTEWFGKIAIDIGCGSGDFFTAMLNRYPDETFVGFEPGVDAESIEAFPVVRDYFQPERDLKLHNPGLLCLRHVVEHLNNPREFLSELAYWSAQYGMSPLLFVEVPCFDKGLATGRAEDLIYEHVSHFTQTSFRTLFEGSGFDLIDTHLMYDDEIICGIAAPSCCKLLTHAGSAREFNTRVATSHTQMDTTLGAILDSEQTVALWGGTGKSVGFINTYELDADRFPIVVDSHEAKCGKFVPGTGQEIVHSTSLLKNPADVIVITTRWRATDIYQEITQRQIPHDRVLYLDGNVLVDYKE